MPTRIVKYKVERRGFYYVVLAKVESRNLFGCLKDIYWENATDDVPKTKKEAKIICQFLNDKL